MKHTALFYFCFITLFFHHYTHSMDPLLLKEAEEFVAENNRVLMPKIKDEATRQAIAEINNLVLQKTKKSPKKTITFFKTPSCPAFIEQLPSDINGIIFDMVINRRTKKLSRVAKPINKLPRLCRSMNTFINNSKNTLALIKNLSDVFDSSHETVAETLQTEGARKRSVVQLAFESICTNTTSISPKKSRILKVGDIDINFTYEPFCRTQLMEACHKKKPLIVKWLLEQGADWSLFYKEEDPVVFNFVNDYSPRGSEIFGYFLASPHFDINHSYKGKNNISMTLLFYFFGLSLRRLLQKDFLAISQLEVLLNHGADPEIPGPGGITPLMIVKAMANTLPTTNDDVTLLENVKHIVTMLEDAIAQKHAAHKNSKHTDKTKNKRHHKKHTHSKKKS